MTGQYLYWRPSLQPAIRPCPLHQKKNFSDPTRYTIPTPFPLKNFRSDTNNPHASENNGIHLALSACIWPRSIWTSTSDRTQRDMCRLFRAVLSVLFGISHHKRTDPADPSDKDFKSTIIWPEQGRTKRRASGCPVRTHPAPAFLVPKRPFSHRRIK